MEKGKRVLVVNVVERGVRKVPYSKNDSIPVFCGNSELVEKVCLVRLFELVEEEKGRRGREGRSKRRGQRGRKGGSVVVRREGRDVLRMSEVGFVDEFV